MEVVYVSCEKCGAKVNEGVASCPRCEDMGFAKIYRGGMSTREVAEVLNLSVERVRQIEKSALRKMRKVGFDLRDFFAYSSEFN